MWQRFTDQAQKSILTAQQEAVARGSHLVGTEHLLLGLLDPNYLAFEALQAMNISPDILRAAIDACSRPVVAFSDSEPKLTVEAKHVLELSSDEARRTNSNHIGPEHLLLALLHHKRNRQQEVDFFCWNALSRFKLIGDATMHAQFNRWRASDNYKAFHVLREHGVELEATRLVIAQLLGARLSSAGPFSEQIQRAIARAQREAEKTGAARLGTAHLLLGLLTEDPLEAQTGSGTLRELLSRVNKELQPDDGWERLRTSLRARLLADGELRSTKTKFTPSAQRALKMSPPESIGGGAMQITLKSLLWGLILASHPPRRVRFGRALGLRLWKTSANDAPREVLELLGLYRKGARLPKAASRTRTATPSVLPDHSDQTTDWRLNLLAFVIPPVCWVPIFATDAGIKPAFSREVMIPILLAPIAGGFIVVGIMVFSKSAKWKTAGLSFIAGIISVAFIMRALGFT